ncbi:MAG TPA: trypsin-like peptidase domain-containing protein [Terriglobia bacterium]|nr:trypsin-like peptidase domain-containing protein [Terriglobia bacterium]
MKRAAGLLVTVLVLPVLLQAQVIAYDYSKLYERSKPAIVQVTTDDGSGSGFLVTTQGHIATNYHVIRNSRYLAVQFPDGRKVRATVAAVNPQYDMAVLKVNSAVVDGIRPLAVLPVDKEDSIRVGVPVVAIGSPLNQKFLMTQGILSKVDSTTLLGDFLLQAGNSGGPLLNCDGLVIGINTFGESAIGGAIRISSLRDFLESDLINQSVDMEPSADLLKSVRAERYPVAILNQKIETEPFDLDSYRIKAGDFTVTAVTPVLIGKLSVLQEKARAINQYARRSKNNSDASFQGVGEPYYEWHRSTETSLDYAVTFDIRPDSGPVKRSAASKIVSPLELFGKHSKREMEFKAEFFDFRLFRDGELVEPIMPGRAVVEGSSDRKNSYFIDQAYAGSYTYSPEEFLTGKEFRIQIIDARKPTEVHKELILTADSKLIRQLRSDFTVNPRIFLTQAP